MHIFRRNRPKVGKIASSRVLQKKYDLYAENRPVIKLNPNNVPQHLSHLIPLAEKWGIGDDIIRGDFEAKATEAEKKELHDALYSPYEKITDWLNSFDTLSEEAAAFMYMQLALDEMGIYILEEKKKSMDGS